MLKLIITNDEKTKQEPLNYIFSKSVKPIYEVKETVTGLDDIKNVQEHKPEKFLRNKNFSKKRENLEIRLIRATDFISSEFIFNLANRPITEEKFIYCLNLINMNFFTGRAFVIKIDYDTYPLFVNSNHQKITLKKRVVRLMENIFMLNNIQCSVNLDTDIILALVYSDKLNQNIESIQEIQKIEKNFKELIKINLSMDIFMGIGPLFYTSNMAINSFREAKNILLEKSFFCDYSVFHDKIPSELEKNIERAVISADREKVVDLFREIELWIQYSPMPFKNKKNNMKEFSTILRHAAFIQFPDSNCFIDTNEITQAESISDLQTAFSNFLEHLMNNISVLSLKDNIPSVKKACRFILENYHRFLSLEETAKHCNLSPFYFSKIFKENKNQNFIHYLTEIRITEAKRLLKETDLSMKEISYKIGYKDPNYFTKVFKRIENCSPTELRSNKKIHTK